jgi:Na+-translocating ferredoxin:NAD+ oxidoreductase RnfD subunit
MTPHDLGFLVAVVCISAVIGTLLGIVCRGRPRISIFCSVVASVLLFITLEWRFGSPEEWSWQHPVTSSAYLFGPFLILVAAPLIGAALLVGHRMMRRKVI